MINKLEKYLKEKNLNEFKLVFANSVINAHHREHLFKLSFMQQDKDFMTFLRSKTSISKEKMTDIFVETLSKKIPIKHFDFVKDLDDMCLLSKFNNVGVSMASAQDDKFLINFIDSYPITCLMNLKKIMFGSFKSGKKEFVDYVTKKQLDKEILFYSALCAIKFESRETFSHMLKNAIKYDPNIITDIKMLKDKHLIQMRGSNYVASKEELDSFIDKTLIETFALHLEEELTPKSAKEVKTTKKMKI